MNFHSSIKITGIETATLKRSETCIEDSMGSNTLTLSTTTPLGTSWLMKYFNARVEKLFRNEGTTMGTLETVNDPINGNPIRVGEIETYDGPKNRKNAVNTNIVKMILLKRDANSWR
jgi:hypothetical protein